MNKKVVQRDTFNYNLKQSKKVVYKGKTKDLDSAFHRHKSDGKKFTHIQKSGAAKSDSSAKREEERQLRVYRQNHGGKNPKFNKSNKG